MKSLKSLTAALLTAALLLPGLTGLAAAALPAGVYTVSMYDYDTDREWLLLQDEWLEVTNLPPEQVPEPAVFEFEKEEIYALPVFAPDDPAAAAWMSSGTTISPR